MLSLILLTAVIYQPVLEPAWSKSEHFPDELLKAPELPYHIPAEKMKKQLQYYKAVPDPEVRRKILTTLRYGANAERYPELLSLLKGENNTSLQADILKLLLLAAEQQTGKIAADPVLKSLLASSSPSVRAYACELLILSGEKTDFLKAVLEKETSASTVEIIFDRLDKQALTLPLITLREIIQNTKNPDLRIRGLEALAKWSPAADREELLRNVKDKRSQLAVINGLGRNPRMPDRLLKEYSKSKDLQILLALASIRPGSNARIDMLKKLLTVREPIIRRQAVISLRYAKSSASLVDAIVPAMSAPERAIRTAAGETLAILTPAVLPDTVLRKVDDPTAFLPLLEIIRAKKNKKYAKFAAEILTDPASADNEEVQVTAVRTLSLLKNPQTAPVILQFADSKFTSVRCEVAKGLRHFPGSATQQALRKLLADNDQQTGVKALDSVRYLKYSALAPEVSTALRNFKHDSIYRAAAIRTLCVFPEKLTAQGVSNLRRLIFTQCIVIGGGAPPAYEQGEVRALAVYLLMLSGRKGNAAAQKLYKEAVAKFRDPFKAISENTLDEFNDENVMRMLCQVFQIRDGKELEKIPAVLPEPEYLIDTARERE